MNISMASLTRKQSYIKKTNKEREQNCPFVVVFSPNPIPNFVKWEFALSWYSYFRVHINPFPRHFAKLSYTLSGAYSYSGTSPPLPSVTNRPGKELWASRNFQTKLTPQQISSSSQPQKATTNSDKDFNSGLN